jgi:hypothetical protein
VETGKILAYLRHSDILYVEGTTMLMAKLIWDYDEENKITYWAIVGPFANKKEASSWRRRMREINGKGKDRMHPRMAINMTYVHDPEQMISLFKSSREEYEWEQAHMKG